MIYIATSKRNKQTKNQKMGIMERRFLFFCDTDQKSAPESSIFQ